MLELSSEGHNQTQIAKVLQVSLATINNDIQYLRQQAKENIKKYIDEKLPLEYKKCLVGLDAILYRTWQIANNSELERDRLQAISVAMQVYNMKIDLLSNAIVVERAVQFVDRNKCGQTEQNYNVRIDVPSNRNQYGPCSLLTLSFPIVSLSLSLYCLSSLGILASSS